MKKGFTLMELVAILVLLALLSTMTYYEASKAVTFAEENTVKQSAILVIEAADHYFSEMEYLNFPSEGISIKKLDIKSTGFLYGYVKLVRSKYVLYNLFDGEYCVNGTRENLVLTKGDCYSNVSGDYVYYQSLTDPLPTTPAEGMPTIPTTYQAYLRFKIEDSNTLGEPQACIMVNNSQFCLGPSSIDKEDEIKRFFNFDPTDPEWHKLNDTTWAVFSSGVDISELNENDYAKFSDKMCTFGNDDANGCFIFSEGERSAGLILTPRVIMALDDSIDGNGTFSCLTIESSAGCQMTD